MYNTGLENNVGYMSTDVDLLTLKYNFHDMMPVPLCSDYLVAGDSNAGQCPADGSYAFAVSYELPSAGDQSTSWLASGWTGSGVIRMYAEDDETMLIGECSFNLKTYVTPSSEKTGFFQTPSAAATVGIVLGAFVAVALVGLWCYCCAKKRRQKIQENPEDMKSITKDDLSTFFKRLDDDNKSRAAQMSVASPYYHHGSVAANSYIPATVATPAPTQRTVPPVGGTVGSHESVVSALASATPEQEVKKKNWLPPFLNRNKESTGISSFPSFGRKKKGEAQQEA